MKITITAALLVFGKARTAHACYQNIQKLVSTKQIKVAQTPSVEQVAEQLIYDLTVSEPRTLLLMFHADERVLMTRNSDHTNCSLVKELLLGEEKLLVLAFSS